MTEEDQGLPPLCFINAKGPTAIESPAKILKRQLTGYCTSPASSPMGRDNKHGWYEEHEKFSGNRRRISVICPSCW